MSDLFIYVWNKRLDCNNNNNNANAEEFYYILLSVLGQ